MRRSILVAFLASVLATPAAAESFLPEPEPPAAPRVDLAASDADEVESGPRVVFRNPGGQPARILFAGGDAEAVVCREDGRATTRARAGQYVLAAGAELPCTAVETGTYDYTVLTAEGGRITRSNGSWVVR